MMADFHCILDPAIDGKMLYQEDPLESTYPVHLHLGGLYNSFYPYDWLKITGAASFRIKIRGTAEEAKVSIFLHTPDALPQLIKQLDVSLTHEEVELELDELSPIPGQRLTCQIESVSAIELEAVSWTAMASNDNKVKLGIVICTYDNEKRVRKNIEQLVASETWEKEKPILILVNNGTIEDDSWFPQERSYKIDQKNLGGSGGFGRGIYEVVYGQAKDLGITHILLMDDDVQFYPETIGRAIAFHRKARKPVVIGGSMLKLDDPTWLHEAGANVTWVHEARANLRSIRKIGISTEVPVGPIEKTGALDFLGRAAQYDYNAWWFCSFPVDAVKAIGMPLPLFIHGDDIEYGTRLKANGFPTYCPGGISLWHESFENKHLTWIRYFDIRNALIRFSMDKSKTGKQLIVEINRKFSGFMMKNDYGACALAIEAYRDFCSGPETLEPNDFSHQIGRLNEILAEYTMPLPTRNYRKSITDTPGRQTSLWIKFLKYITANMAYRRGRTQTLWTTKSTRYAWWNVPFYADIIVENMGGEIFFPRDHKIARELRATLRGVTHNHGDRLDSIMEDWRNSMPLFSSPGFWETYCKAPK